MEFDVAITIEFIPLPDEKKPAWDEGIRVLVEMLIDECGMQNEEVGEVSDE